jgi:hypothetical protein
MGLFSRDTTNDPYLTTAFARYATQSGLTHRGLFPEVFMHGAVAGVPFDFSQREVETQHTDSKGETHTSRVWRAEVWLYDPEWLGDLCVEREHTLHRIVKFFGAQDLRMGIPSFDETFMVRCSDEGRARRILTPAACAALEIVWAEKHRVMIFNQRVEYVYSGMISDPREVDTMIRAFTFVLASLGR